MKWACVPIAMLLVISIVATTFAQDGPRGARRDADRPGPPPGTSHEGAEQAPHEERVERKSERRWHERGKPMSEEDAREAIEILRRIDPEKAERLDKAVAERPEQVARVLHEQFPNMGRFMAWRRYDPEGFDLRVDDMALSRETHECVKRLHEALDDENDEAATFEQLKLEDLVAQHFEVRQKIREHELAKLRDRIEQLEAQLKERAANRDEYITQRVDDLIDGEHEARW